MSMTKDDAVNAAVEYAKEDLGEKFESWELWEASDKDVTVRAWNSDGDYEFYSESYGPRPAPDKWLMAVGGRG